jgi:hypothetical protein
VGNETLKQRFHERRQEKGIRKIPEITKKTGAKERYSFQNFQQKRNPNFGKNAVLNHI